MANSDNTPDQSLSAGSAATEPKPRMPVAAKAEASRFARLREWLLMRDAFLAARAQDETCPMGRQHCLMMALAHAEGADFLLATRDKTPLPPILTLCREALLWALAEDEEGRRALLVALETSPQSLQTGNATDDPRQARLRHLLVMYSQLGSGQSSPLEQRQMAQMAAASVKALVDKTRVNQGAARRQAARTRRKRWALAATSLIGGLALLLSLMLWAFWPRDLAEGKPWHASSALQGLYYAQVLFHTNEELNPWFEVDLLRPKYFHRVIVKNRPECCWERAVPLILEVSDDRNHWDEVERRDTAFTIWETTFPPVQARYVRLRVPRFSILHLEQVQIY